MGRCASKTRSPAHTCDARRVDVGRLQRGLAGYLKSDHAVGVPVELPSSRNTAQDHKPSLTKPCDPRSLVHGCTGLCFEERSRMSARGAETLVVVTALPCSFWSPSRHSAASCRPRCRRSDGNCDGWAPATSKEGQPAPPSGATPQR